MKFKAIITSRSTLNEKGPPSEAEILRLNPQRREIILNKPAWIGLYEGTLNLKVQESIVYQIRKIKPFIQETGNSVCYPEPYKNIPKKRKNYFYYTGTISKGDCFQDVLFRIAEMPPRKDLIEAFAPERLRNTLNLEDGNQVICDIID
ncbi:MAG: DUF120 domain-containing protein [Atribacterota bacterium]